MTALSVEKFYNRYYAGKKARSGLFETLAEWRQPKKVLYPGSFIHVTASFIFFSVVYVDNDKNAKRFFAKMDDVVSLVNRYKTYAEKPNLVFHDSNYENDIEEAEGSFDLLISLYAGFVSKPCKRYLRNGGILAANDSHGDASLSSIDPDYELIGVIQGEDDHLRVIEDNLKAYFKPKKQIEVTEELLRKLKRGISYTKTARAYLFKRVH